MGQIEELFKRLAEDFYHYLFVGSMDDAESLLDTIDFFLDRVDHQNFSHKLVDPKTILHVYTVDIPKDFPIFFGEGLLIYQALMDLYFELKQVDLISSEDCKRIQMLLQENKNLFFYRLIDSSFWGASKKELLVEMTDNEIVDFAQVTKTMLDEINHDKTNLKSNVIPFPNMDTGIFDSFEEDDGMLKGFQLRVDIVGEKPPVWRRILVPEEISYRQLSDILQLIFQIDRKGKYSFKASQGLIQEVEELTEDYLKRHLVQVEEELVTSFIGKNKEPFHYYYSSMGDELELKVKVEDLLGLEDFFKEVKPICAKLVGKNPNSRQQEQPQLEEINRKLADYWHKEMTKK